MNDWLALLLEHHADHIVLQQIVADRHEAGGAVVDDEMTILAQLADAFLDMRNQSAADDLSREDWLGLLIDHEVTARDNKRLGRRLSLARLRQNAVIEDADLRTPRGLDRGLFQSLTTCGWIRDSHHVLITGPTDQAT